jgi:hypothetical protein
MPVPPADWSFCHAACQLISSLRCAALCAGVARRSPSSTVLRGDPWGIFIRQLQAGQGVEQVVAAEFRAVYGDELGHVS